MKNLGFACLVLAALLGTPSLANANSFPNCTTDYEMPRLVAELYNAQVYAKLAADRLEYEAAHPDKAMLYQSMWGPAYDQSRIASVAARMRTISNLLLGELTFNCGGKPSECDTDQVYAATYSDGTNTIYTCQKMFENLPNANGFTIAAVIVHEVSHWLGFTDVYCSTPQVCQQYGWDYPDAAAANADNYAWAAMIAAYLGPVNPNDPNDPNNNAAMQSACQKAGKGMFCDYPDISKLKCSTMPGERGGNPLPIVALGLVLLAALSRRKFLRS